MKSKLKKLLVFAICASMVMSSMTVFASSGEGAGEGTGEEITLYYSSWNDAYKALKEYCGIADPSSYTEAQGDLVNAFLDKWPDILYGATDEDEANSLLKDAKAEFDALPLDDEEAMEEHKAFIAERETVFNEKMAIMESNIANAKYTGDSRFDYETAAREALGTILNASNHDELNSGKAAFDSCVSLLVEVSPELKAAQEAAKNELASILANEYDNITTIDDYYSRIDNCNNKDEIASVVEECKEYMLACVNADIATYRNNKLTKAADYCRSFESKLGAEKFNELKTYYRDNMGALNGATNKADVDRAYNDLVTALDSKVAELLGGGEVEPEEPTDVAVTGIALDKTQLTLEVESEEQLVATITPDNATDKTVTWTTSDSSIVTIENGKVVAVKVGTAVVTAKAGEFTATCTVTVKAKEVVPEEPEDVAVTGIALNKTEATIKVDETLTLTATVNPENATDKTVTWSVDDAEVATVTNGVVTAKKAGTAVVTAKAGKFTATCTVTVTSKEVEPEEPEDTTIKVVSVTLNKVEISLEEGKTEKLTATIDPVDATNKEMTWESSNSAVVTVDKDGNLTAVKAGTATITVKVDGKTATCAVTVTAATQEPGDGEGTVDPGEGEKPGDNNKPGDETEKPEDNDKPSSGNESEKEDDDKDSSNKDKEDKDKDKDKDNKDDKTENKSEDTYLKATVKGDIDGLSIKYTRLATPDLAAYKKAIGSTKVACFFDVVANIDGKNATKLDKEISFTLEIPAEFVKEGRSFYLVRNHEGKIERLNDTDKVANTITVKSSQFSGYLLTYTDGAVKEDGSPITGDNTNLFAYMSVAAVSAAGLFFTLKKKEQ